MSRRTRIRTTPPAGLVLDDRDVIHEYKDRKVWLTPRGIVKRTYADAGSSEIASHHFLAEWCPTIPIPRILDEWESRYGDHSFTMMSTIRGVSLTRAWRRLSDTQRGRIATKVAEHLRTLRRFGSSRMRSVSGKPLRNNCFVPVVNHHHQTHLWTSDNQVFDEAFRPVLESSGVSPNRIELIRRTMPPCMGQFALYHGDLYTGNIMVDPEQGKLTGIIDWEFLGYWPLWFHYARLGFEVNDDDGRWKRILSGLLKNEIPHALQGRVWWHAMEKIIDHPTSKTARVWFELLDDYLAGYDIPVSLEHYQLLRSRDGQY
ncbi:kinase-like domain-containing protein [Cladorrhinum sp. PSN259]|nr:kinase-like domain-containing protein [Cladorrhinum sp. PSN259]